MRLLGVVVIVACYCVLLLNGCVVVQAPRAAPFFKDLSEKSARELNDDLGDILAEMCRREKKLDDRCREILSERKRSL